MWKVLTAAAMLGVVVLLLRPDHYKAIRHEFYQVWDAIGGDSNE